MKKIKKYVGIAAGILLVAACLLVGGLTILEYRPQPREQLPEIEGETPCQRGETLTILTWNTGYGALSESEDFFMDGGEKVQPESKALVEANLEGIAKVLKEQEADFYFLQEVDLDSKRSFHTDQQAYYEKALGMDSIFAYNFKCRFVPYPLPFIGQVESGLLLLTEHPVKEATRIALPESFSWPVRTCNLKRCILEARVPLEGSSRELVLLNFHLEAYDSGEGKIAQSRMLSEILKEEYEKGNYVIAGGDLNQIVEGIQNYPLQEGSWVPGQLGKEDIPENFSFVMAEEFPTCRLLNRPYRGNEENAQFYIIDGFIVSDNLKVESVETVDLDFQYTDHQPVKLTVTLP